MLMLDCFPFASPRDFSINHFHPGTQSMPSEGQPPTSAGLGEMEMEAPLLVLPSDWKCHTMFIITSESGYFRFTQGS